MTTRDRYETAIFELPAEGVARITLNRPEHGNGVVPQSAADLADMFARVENDKQVRAVVLTGAGQQFCAGADLRAFKRYLEEDLEVTEEPFNARVLFPVTQKILSLRVPVVAAINGGATAGGLDLAMACDIRVASERAKLGETYINIGLAPGNGGTYFLPRLVGSGWAAELALTGKVLDAVEALKIGLVNHVVAHDDLEAFALDLATAIASKPRHAVEATKQALRTSWQTDLLGSMNAGYWAVGALHYTDDLREGIDAFLERRPPRFNVPRSGRSAPRS